AGDRRPLPEFRESAGRTTLTLRLAPTGSGFVVFRRFTAGGPAIAGENVSIESVVASVNGPWEIEFDPKWGGPAVAKFAALDDWSQRPEPGIRNYSGIAVYRTTFDLPVNNPAPAANRLNLGDVRAMARVRLNGTDLGVVWCAPWSLKVPLGLLKPTGNQLEITVANLWVNRLIGDAGLPESERFTKTTENSYLPNDTLKSSGLLGPVELRSRNE
ncbi:MAG: hypothetical protein JWM57_137, partial [Phycisphaerales bacterium]|nr:hypothetical protein [Phycisphaerales bacterium]